ncbi:hypothetical protein [Streptomyces narbonensis]|uniref:hypothetical protein n=1 Tax=Streptomyces narbonensis TaxID=67333 RepID=UPI0033DEB4C0
MRRLLWVAAGLAGIAAVSGCGAPQASGPAAGTTTAPPSATAAPSASRTPAGATAGTKHDTKAGAAELLARAEAAMDAEAGWTFTVTGRESLKQSGAPEGQGSRASYSATVDRTARPEALHQTGTVIGKNGSRPEEVVTAGGTGYVREGAPGSAWTKGPLTDPEIAAKVEDPLDALATFADYAERGERIEVVRSGGEIRLRLRLPSASLAEREERPAVARAAREFLPTLEKLRKAGVTAGEKKIVLTGFEESLVLDARTHRMTSYRSSFGFAVPHEGRQLRYAQELGADTRGVFTGRIEAPVTAR